MLKFTDRTTRQMIRGCKFSSVEEMNEHMIERWNSVVKQGDTVYHLGDVVMGANSENWMKLNWGRLNGSKRLIVGNHDDVKMLSTGGWFKKVSMWRMFPEFSCVLTHAPIHASGLLKQPRGSTAVWPDDTDVLMNVHGHIHQNKSPQGPYMNVSVEMIDYTPVNMEDIAVIAGNYAENSWPVDKYRVLPEMFSVDNA